MTFNSLEFAIFFLIVYSLYLISNHKRQNRLLLVASIIFYGAWDWRFLSLLFTSVILDYFCGLRIKESAEPYITPDDLNQNIIQRVPFTNLIDKNFNHTKLYLDQTDFFRWSSWRDGDHLNPQGREVFSKLLSQEITEFVRKQRVE